MLDLRSIRSITLDIADSYTDGEVQDQAAELIMRLLGQNYQIYLFSSNSNHPVSQEAFEHPALRFLREPMPPLPALAAALPGLVSPANLWITDDGELQKWLRQRDLPLATRSDPADIASPRVIRYRHLAELASSLDPTMRVMQEIVSRMGSNQLKQPGSSGARVIAIGGPPLAGQAEFALSLKRYLEAEGHPLVELLDLSALGLGSSVHEAAEDDPAGAGDQDSAAWLAEQISRLRGGESVYLERLPAGIPPAFEPHLPLFWSPETVILAFGEMIFIPALDECFDFTVLLENTPQETTRRIYELDEERFDPRFTEQYLQREGKAYERYLAEYAVRDKARLRVDSNTPGAYFLAGAYPSAAAGISS